MKKKEKTKKAEVKKVQKSKKQTRPDTPAFGSPFRLMRHFAEEMENMLAEFGFDREFPRMLPFGNDPFGFEQADLFGNFSPAVEVFERDGQLIVRADLPGLEKDDIEVEVHDRRMIIKGERKQESEEKGEDFYRSEFSYGSFYRELPLPEGVKTGDAKAFFKNGVLEIAMAAPKLAAGGKRLEIKDENPKTKVLAKGG